MSGQSIYMELEKAVELDGKTLIHGKVQRFEPDKMITHTFKDLEWWKHYSL